MPNLDLLKKLRNKTGVSMMQCQKALAEAGDDIEKAEEILRKKGQAAMDKRGDREAGQGIIDAYIHANGKVGVLLDIRCESDFVARSDDFKNLAHEISLQIAASAPKYISREDIPAELVAKEKEICEEQLAGKPAQAVEGKLNKQLSEICLLTQPWIKENDRTIQNLIEEYTLKIGEKLEVRHFTRYEI